MSLLCIVYTYRYCIKNNIPSLTDVKIIIIVVSKCIQDIIIKVDLTK